MLHGDFLKAERPTFGRCETHTVLEKRMPGTRVDRMIAQFEYWRGGLSCELTALVFEALKAPGSCQRSVFENDHFIVIELLDGGEAISSGEQR